MEFDTVLLVDEEESLRSMVGEFLERHGYRVLKAAAGLEALRIAARHGSGILFVITAVEMTDMSGPQLAQRVAQLHPEARILFTSDHAKEAVVQQGELDPGAAFLQKPFSLEALASKLREVVKESSAAKTRA